MSPRIPVSFKSTTRDIKLYTHLISLEDRSSYIKAAIRFYLKYNHLENKLIELLNNEEKHKNKPTD